MIHIRYCYYSFGLPQWRSQEVLLEEEDLRKAALCALDFRRNVEHEDLNVRFPLQNDICKPIHLHNIYIYVYLIHTHRVHIYIDILIYIYIYIFIDIYIYILIYIY